uniref:Uncharacterized protein n=1 Tax=Ciona intestinalis TaxID=7719 RepID=H2XVJ1_CIOIN
MTSEDSFVTSDVDEDTFLIAPALYNWHDKHI